MKDQDNISNALISEYVAKADQLARQFYDIYFNDEDDHIYWDEWYFIGLEHWPWVVEISDYYFNIDDIFVALNLHASSDDLLKWYDYSLTHHTENKKWNPINLYSWLKWSRNYLPEEIKESEEKAQKARKILEDEINKA